MMQLANSSYDRPKDFILQKDSTFVDFTGRKSPKARVINNPYRYDREPLPSLNRAGLATRREPDRPGTSSLGSPTQREPNEKRKRRTETFAPVPKHRKSSGVALLGFCERHYFVKGSVQDVETGSVLEIV